MQSNIDSLRVLSLLWVARVIRIFRVGRVTRMLRVVRHVVPLQRLFSTFMFSMPALVNIISFMAIIYYLFAVLATEAYGHPGVYPTVSDTHEANCEQLFTSVSYSMLTLFRAGTFDNWVTMMNACYMRGSAAICLYVALCMRVLVSGSPLWWCGDGCRDGCRDGYCVCVGFV